MMRQKNQIIRDLQIIIEKLERLDVAIITRYPDSARAADEYAALRKGILTLASATTMYQQNLIALINTIDEGANPQTVRGKLCDLLNTWGIEEVKPTQVVELVQDEVSDIFQVVRDEANERSAWIRKREDFIDVVQRGYITDMPPRADGENQEVRASGKNDASEYFVGTKAELANDSIDPTQTQPGRPGEGQQTS